MTSICCATFRLLEDRWVKVTAKPAANAAQYRQPTDISP
jgi:hypothetical protein